MPETALVRYGVIPEVSRFVQTLPTPPERGARVIVNTRRGLELGTLLELLKPTDPSAATEAESTPSGELVRVATSEDRAWAADLRVEAQVEFGVWQQRLRDWHLELELIDAEWTHDRQRLVLYVLGGRGSDTTKLALQAATLGLSVEVQPVDATGLVQIASEGGGCGCGESGGCGS
jgi:cell fate regulator YaaT (PSP1 superfamily)